MKPEACRLHGRNRERELEDRAAKSIEHGSMNGIGKGQFLQRMPVACRSCCNHASELARVDRLSPLRVSGDFSLFVNM